MDLDWLIVILTALVVLVATAVHGIVGFGTGQITMGVLPLFREPGPASIIVSLIVFVTNVRVFWSVREKFTWRDYLIPVAGLVVGLPVGIYAFGALDQEQISLVIGIVMLVAAVAILLTRQVNAVGEWIRRTGYQPGWVSAVIAGFLSGVFGGAVSIPGPPMLIYGTFLLEVGYWEAGHMKSVFTAFFATNLLYRLVVLFFMGDVTAPLALEALIVAPMLFVGTWIGIKLYNRIDRETFSWIAIIFIFLLSILLIFG